MVQQQKNPGNKENRYSLPGFMGDDAKEVRVRNPSEETYTAQIAVAILHVFRWEAKSIQYELEVGGTVKKNALS